MATRSAATWFVSRITAPLSYGFPERHAASLALLANASSWMKCRHPDVFLAAILNAQPIGFYAPALLVRDARLHGLTVRPADVNTSCWWDCTLEPIAAGERLCQQDAAVIAAVRADKPFGSIDELGGGPPFRLPRWSGSPMPTPSVPRSG